MARRPVSDALVLFGATGDLARKKIFPAVYAMQRDGRAGMPIIGVASSDLSDDDLRQRAHDAVLESAGDGFDSAAWTTSPRG
jgi:glucose-6-phosphate 1-dehydrogenase